jgi:sterol desaturase/sphingolipid hydroxylase (fatty acid hydroxylase superfamily)
MGTLAWIAANEVAIRFAAFAGLFLAFAGVEALRPDLPRLRARTARWTANLGLALTSSAMLRLLLPGAAVLAAVFAQMRGWGAMNVVGLPLWVEILAAIVVLDLAIYAQHVLTHRIPILWRLHRVHHADREVDVSTALRFHPVEMILSMIYKIAIVVALGAHPVAVVLFEIVLNGCAMFNHANLKITPRADRLLRTILVTPAMHRIHHSERLEETNANFGFSLSLWDRMFGTYRVEPALPLVVGLAEFRDERPHELFWSLALPFRSRG